MYGIYGDSLAGKNVGLVVSSHTSGISGVESDCKRLIPASTCHYLSKSLWINASNHSRRASLIEQWLKDVNFSSLTINTQSSTMNITINGKTAICNLADNAATKALLKRLSNGNVTCNVHEYGGFEMVGALGFSLPTSDTQITTQLGDVMLYTGNNICIFTGQNTWAYTPIGRIEGMSASELRDFLNMDDGNATITLSLKN